jgi:hypothetical protein
MAPAHRPLPSEQCANERGSVRESPLKKKLFAKNSSITILPEQTPQNFAAQEKNAAWF